MKREKKMNKERLQISLFKWFDTDKNEARKNESGGRTNGVNG